MRDERWAFASKRALANERGLAGAGFWAIGCERGLPAYTDLIARFVAGSPRGSRIAEAPGGVPGASSAASIASGDASRPW